MSNDQPYQLELGVFEGPLDLLLHLIDKNELNIYDIPLHLLAEQYVVYLESLESLDMEVASEFLIVAARLMHLKSKALLPKVPTLVDESEEDLEEQLRRQLLEYRIFKKISLLFQEILEVKEYYSRLPGEIPIQVLKLEPQNPFFLLDAWKNLQSGQMPLFEPEEVISIEPFNIEERMGEIEVEIRKTTQERFRLDLLLGKQKSKTAWLVSILAVLELVRLKKIQISQNRHFSHIYLLKGKDGKS